MKGFGRGSTELGFPTANFADEVDKFWNEERIIVFYSTGDWSIARSIDRRNLLGSCPSGWWSGLWYGRCHFLYRHLPWPCVKVMSIGWNPFYENKKRAMETHIVHKFDEADLYGRQLKVVNNIEFGLFSARQYHYTGYHFGLYKARAELWFLRGIDRCNQVGKWHGVWLKFIET